MTIESPTPEQLVQLREFHDKDVALLADLVQTHSCDVLNGADHVVATALLHRKLSRHNPSALAELLAVAIDRLAEETWGGAR